MEYQKINWVHIHDESQETLVNNKIKPKTSMIRSNLCDYSDAYIYVKGTITFPYTGTAAAPNNKNKKVIIKNVLHLLIVQVKYIIHK